MIRCFNCRKITRFSILLSITNKAVSCGLVSSLPCSRYMKKSTLSTFKTSITISNKSPHKKVHKKLLKPASSHFLCPVRNCRQLSFSINRLLQKTFMKEADSGDPSYSLTFPLINKTQTKPNTPLLYQTNKSSKTKIIQDSFKLTLAPTLSVNGNSTEPDTRASSS